MRDSDIILRDQFCENVRDHMLRRELKRLVRERGSLTLLDVRSEAIWWVEEGQPSRDKQVRQPPVCEAQVTTSCDAVAVGPLSELAELKNLVFKQHVQLELLVKHLGPSSQPAEKPPARANRFRRAPDGQPICVRCNMPGYIAHFCQASLSIASRQASSSSSTHY